MKAKNIVSVRIFMLVAVLMATPDVYAQKKVLDHTVYDAWKSLHQMALTNDGRYAVAVVQEQEGNDHVLIQQVGKERRLVIPRAYRYSVTPDEKYVVALIKAPFDVLREAKIKKTKAEKMPKDTLAIVALEDFSTVKIPDVASFKMGKDTSEYIAYTLSDTTAVKDKNDRTAATLVLHRLRDAKKDTLTNVVEYQLSNNGSALAAAIQPLKKKAAGANRSDTVPSNPPNGGQKNDTVEANRMLYMKMSTGEKRYVSSGHTVYKNIALSESGAKLAFLATSEPVKKEVKEYKLYYYTPTADSAMALAGKNVHGMPSGWCVSEHDTPIFSKNEARLFLGTAPEATPKDTTIPDFERAALDVWHWKDPRVQPQQLVELDKDRKKSYLAYVDLNGNRYLYQLATEEIPDVQVADEHNGRFALGFSNKSYLLEATWSTTARRTNDFWAIDMQEHSCRKIKTGLSAEFHFSPQGSYLVWYDVKDRKYYAYSLLTHSEICLTDSLTVSFMNEKHTTPSLPPSYGAAAWTEDENLLVNDAYDIWKLDPSGRQQPVCVTKGVGRASKTTLRYFSTEPESRYIKPKEKIMLSAFDEVTKERGFYELEKYMTKSEPKKLIVDKYTFSTPVKAKNKEVFLYEKSNFHTSPDLYVTTNRWKTEARLSDINPQMREYSWGRAELASWTTFDGKPTQGVVYKPEGLDTTKKYPVIVYFYEKHSDELYKYIPPIPSRSTVNISFYCSRGYVVFAPDIQYTTGRPGESAFSSVVSGVEKLCENAWADRQRIGIQGQSWGGYQTAYLVTRTGMFRAAGAGAPVSNMFSAYGGIRWSTGMSREYQYEQGQSRIGATMWEAPELYRENSPVFFADKIETPLLIMHNDKDGAVPWYQGVELFMALRRLNKPAWMLQYNGEQHNLVERKNRKDLTVRLQQFFDHYLKDAPMPIWMKDGLPAVKKGADMGLSY
ncbi:MAG: prolyl oligopeptidase family serine peptidase [Prevotellaceae bacterium]|jgi:dipeptidyl aminopeptidase/acylaminoacyl peptidase|nr:prolyl oligopeptidase family serine peptidase [Prevotellaceae bacterium]